MFKTVLFASLLLSTTALAQSIGGNVIPPGGGGGGSSTPQTPNYVFAGPPSGVTAGLPSFRALVNADLPGTGSVTINGVTCTLGSSCNVINNAIWAPLASQLGAL